MNRWIASLVAGAGIAGLSGCASPTLAGKRDCCRLLAAGSLAASAPIYDTAVAWETDAGRPLALTALAGRPQVVAMFYASCHVICPLTLQRLKQVAAELPAATRSRVGFVLVTLDPAGDSPAALRAFRRAEQLPDRWVLLRGARRATENLAGALGVAYANDRNRLAHSAQIAVLNRDGAVVFRQLDLHENPKPLVEAIELCAALP